MRAPRLPIIANPGVDFREFSSRSICESLTRPALVYIQIYSTFEINQTVRSYINHLRLPVNILSTPDSAILDSATPYSHVTGLDSLPAWLLRIGAPVLCKCKPLTYLTFHSLTLSTSIVPTQWKLTSICPVRKVNQPTAHSHFRPISITPVLTRMMQRMITRDFVYPAFLTPPPFLRFSDQFVFRPTGFTTAALTYLSSTPLQTSLPRTHTSLCWH